MSRDIMSESKKIIYEFYNNGEWVENPSFIVNNREIPEYSKEFLGQLFRFFINSKFLSDYSKEWLLTNLPSIREMVETMNMKSVEMKHVNFNTVQSALRYDKNRLANYFDGDTIINCICRDVEYTEQLNGILDTLVRKYMKGNEYNKQLVIKIPDNLVRNKISASECIKLMDILETYSKRKIKEIEREGNSIMTTDMIGYYNYLISSNRLNDIDKENLKRIKLILGM